MNIGRTIRRTVRPLWVAAVGAALWSNRRQLLEAFQRWSQKAGSAASGMAGGGSAVRAPAWMSRVRPQASTARNGDGTGPMEPTAAEQVGAIW
jgi:hypothetical protein